MGTRGKNIKSVGSHRMLVSAIHATRVRGGVGGVRRDERLGSGPPLSDVMSARSEPSLASPLAGGSLTGPRSSLPSALCKTGVLWNRPHRHTQLMNLQASACAPASHYLPKKRACNSATFWVPATGGLVLTKPLLTAPSLAAGGRIERRGRLCARIWRRQMEPGLHNRDG